MNNKSLSIIVAMTENGLIGCNSRLPWNIPEDLKLFREITIGSGRNALIMGKNTYNMLGRPLSQRANIVVSESVAQSSIKDRKYSDVIVKASLSDAIRFTNLRYDDVFLIGGIRIYEEGLPLVDKMYISLIKKEYDGNIYFPKFDKDEWNIEKVSEYNEFDLLKYVRR